MQKCRWGFLGQKNRGAVALQRNVASRAPRMRGEFPATPRVRAGRGFGSRLFRRWIKNNGPVACARGPLFFI